MLWESVVIIKKIFLYLVTVENDAYCIDILTQVSAINAALNSFNKVLIANHIRTCVKENIQAGNDEVIEELVVTLQKLMK